MKGTASLMDHPVAELPWRAIACTLLGVAALADPARLSGPWVGPLVWAVLVFVVAESAWRVARTACPDAPPAWCCWPRAQ